MSKKNDFFEKIKTMDLEQLWIHYDAAKGTNRVLNITGILIIFLLCLYTSPFTLVPGAFVVYVIANMSINIGEIISKIEERIVDLADK